MRTERKASRKARTSFTDSNKKTQKKEFSTKTEKQNETQESPILLKKKKRSESKEKEESKLTKKGENTKPTPLLIEPSESSPNKEEEEKKIERTNTNQNPLFPSQDIIKMEDLEFPDSSPLLQTNPSSLLHQHQHQHPHPQQQHYQHHYQQDDKTQFSHFTIKESASFQQTQEHALNSQISSSIACSQECIYIFGTANRVLKLDVNTHQWKCDVIPANSQYKFKNFSSAVSIPHQKSILITGGGPSNEVYLYTTTPSGFSVRKSAGMLRKRAWHSILYLNGLVYVLGNWSLSFF